MISNALSHLSGPPAGTAGVPKHRLKTTKATATRTRDFRAAPPGITDPPFKPVVHPVHPQQMSHQKTAASPLLPIELKKIPAALARELARIPNSPTAAIERYIKAESALSIKKECHSRFKTVENPRGTVVLLHGYSAGTWQYDEWQQQYLDQGFNVFVPRLAGNGLCNPKTGEDDLSKLPTTGHKKEWQRYSDQIYTMANQTGVPVHVVGISGGGTCAAYLAQTHPDIQSTVLMAPYFTTANRLVKSLMVLDDVVGLLSLRLSDKLLDLASYDWHSKKDGDIKNPVYKKITLGSLKCLRQFGKDILSSKKNVRSKTVLFTSDADISAAQKPIYQFWDTITGVKNHIHFDKEQKVPHTMMNAREFSNTAIIDQIKATALSAAMG